MPILDAGSSIIIEEVPSDPLLSTADFLKLLFDGPESACFSPDTKGTRIYGAHRPPAFSRFVSINPIHPTQDFNPTQNYHSPFRPRRADANCTALRTILCEFDKGPIDQQLDYLRRQQLPVSALTYSGGKSIHALIVLQESLDTAAYQRLVRRVFRVLAAEVDPANKNPSRLTRLPNAVRENGSVQKLLHLGERIRLQELEAWLERSGAREEDSTPRQESLPGFSTGHTPSPYLTKSTQEFLEGQYEEGTWNIRLFKTCCELFSKGQPFEQVVETCTRITGYLDTKDLNTIRSAFRTAAPLRPLER